MNCFKDIMWFFKHLIIFAIMFGLIMLILFSIFDVEAGLFSRDKINHNTIVSDTTVIHVPSKKYVVLCFDELFEGKLHDCYTLEVTEFLECIDDNYLERKPKPTPTYTPIPFDNQPKK